MDLSIRLTPEELHAQSGEMNALMQEYEELFSKTTGILNSTNADWSANLANNFTAKILSAQKGFSSVVDVLGFGVEAVKSSAETFNNLDANLSKAIDGAKSAGKDVGKKIVGGAGIIGSAVSVGWSVKEHFGDLVNGDKNKRISAVGGLAKDFYSTIKLLNTTVSSTQKCEKLFRMLPGQAAKTGLKKAFGLQKVSTLFPNGYVSKSFYNNFHKLDSITDAYTKGGMKSALAYAGTAMDLVCNGVSNYQEMKEGKISKGRAVAETVTETAIDVGKDWLIATAVTAGIATLTAGAAPVVAVAAGTAVVSMGLDWACQKLTKKFMGEEKKVTEFVSDAVLDGAKYAYDKGKEIVKSVGEKATKAKEVVGNAVGNATKAATKKLGKVCSKIKSWF